MGGKLKAACILALMFVLGAVSGSAWQVYRFQHRFNRTLFADRRIARLSKELKLNAWQEQSLRDIIQDAHERAQDLHDALDFDMAQIHEDSVDAIQGLLTPEQQQKFEAMHKRSHAKWHKEDSRDAITPQVSTGGATS